MVHKMPWNEVKSSVSRFSFESHNNDSLTIQSNSRACFTYQWMFFVNCLQFETWNAVSNMFQLTDCFGIVQAYCSRRCKLYCRRLHRDGRRQSLGTINPCRQHIFKDLKRSVQLLKRLVSLAENNIFYDRGEALVHNRGGKNRNSCYRSRDRLVYLFYGSSWTFDTSVVKYFKLLFYDSKKSSVTAFFLKQRGVSEPRSSKM